jgi:tetratricopeptide (TPR) repeat protein
MKEILHLLKKYLKPKAKKENNDLLVKDEKPKYGINVKRTPKKFDFFEAVYACDSKKNSLWRKIIKRKTSVQILGVMAILICVLFIIDENYFTAASSIGIYVFFVISKLKKIVMKNYYNIILIISAAVIIYTGIHMSSVEGYESELIAKSISYIGDTGITEKVGINRRVVYNVADSLSGRNLIPVIKKGVKTLEPQRKNDLILNIEKYLLEGQENFENYFVLGKLYLEKNQIRRSSVYFEQAYNLDLNNDFDTIYEYVKTLQLRGEYDKIQEISESMRNTDSTIIYHIRGALDYNSGMYQEAIKLYKKIIKEKNDDGYLYAVLANCLLEVGKIDEAENYIEIAIDLDEKFYYTNFIKGLVHFEKGEFIQANKFFKESNIQYNTKVAKGYILLTSLKLNEAKYFNREWNKLKTERENSPEFSYVKALINLELFNLEEALIEIEKTIELNSDKSKYYALKAEILMGKNNLEEVVENLKIAFEQNMKDIHALKTFGKLLIYLNEPINAEQIFSQIIEYNPYKPDIIAYLGYTFNAMDNKESAYDLIKIGIEAAPLNYEVYYIKAITDYERKRYNSAIESVDLALELNRNNLYIKRLKILIMKKLGLEEESRRLAQEIIMLHPNDNLNKLLYIDSIINIEEQLDELDNLGSLEDNWTKAYETKAKKLLSMGRYEDAAIAASKTVETFSEIYTEIDNLYKLINLSKASTYNYFPKYLEYKGQEFELNNHRKLVYLNKLIKSNPYFKDFEYLKGMIYIEEENYSNAIESFEKAYKLESNYNESVVTNKDIFEALLEVYKQTDNQEKIDETNTIISNLKLLEG